MARSVGKIFADIWQDPDWVRLSAPAQRTFLLILTQAKVNLAGVIDLKLERWALMAHDTTVEDLQADLAELEQRRFLIVDRVTEEVAIRTFVKHDVGTGTFNRNTGKGVWSAWKSVESERIRAEIVHAIPDDLWKEKLGPHAPEQAARIRRSGPPPPPSPDHGPNHGSDHGPNEQTEPQSEPSIDRLPTPSTASAATTDRTADTPTEPDPAEPPQVAAAADPEHTVRAALALLVDRTIARKPAHSNPAGYRRSLETGKHTDHYDDAHDWLHRDPHLTPEELADILEPPPRPALASTPSDESVQRQRAFELLSNPRCPRCSGTTWLAASLNDDGTWGPVQPCPDCNPEARTA